MQNPIDTIRLSGILYPIECFWMMHATRLLIQARTWLELQGVTIKGIAYEHGHNYLLSTRSSPPPKKGRSRQPWHWAPNQGAVLQLGDERLTVENAAYPIEPMNGTPSSTSEYEIGASVINGSVPEQHHARYQTTNQCGHISHLPHR